MGANTINIVINTNLKNIGRTIFMVFFMVLLWYVQYYGISILWQIFFTQNIGCPYLAKSWPEFKDNIWKDLINDIFS